MRRRARKDENQNPIVAALNDLYVSVVDLSAVGCGLTDLLIGHRGVNYLIEIKNPNQPKSKRKLTKDQVEFHATWRGQKAVVESVDEILQIIGVTK